jgi:hypothetical protein
VLGTASIDRAIERSLTSEGAPAQGDGTSTAGDRAAMLATFEDLAVAHTAPVRSFMLEARWGEAQTAWIDLTRPALRSLRAMGDQIGNGALTAALDGFDAALDRLVQPGAPATLDAAARDALLAAYAPLIACMPRAFELEGERDRREPLVVRALLEQVPGLDALMIERMTAAGLGRLDTLVRARPDELAAVAGIAPEIAAATTARVQDFRRATQAALATLDPVATARELAALVQALQADHRAFEEAARGWSEQSRTAKRDLRARRQTTFLQILIALARLGEVDLALRLEKLAFARRLDELERFVTRSLPAGAGVPAATAAAGPPPAAPRMEGGVQPGAPAAP